jgi:hypothetical protein
MVRLGSRIISSLLFITVVCATTSTGTDRAPALLWTRRLPVGLPTSSSTAGLTPQQRLLFGGSQQRKSSSGPTKSSDVALSLRGGGDNYYLTKVFQVYRFVGLSFGVILAFFPELFAAVYKAKDPMPRGEREPAKIYGCFILAVAYIAHSAIKFEADAQTQVARALFGCFSLASLFTILDMVNGKGEYRHEHVNAFVLTYLIPYVGLAGAYGLGLFVYN